LDCSCLEGEGGDLDEVLYALKDDELEAEDCRLKDDMRGRVMLYREWPVGTSYDCDFVRECDGGLTD
jgi:hypothetical protein